MSVLGDKLRALAAEADGAAPTTSPADWRSETGFPKVKMIDGVLITLTEPISPQWLPSTYAHTYGGTPSDPKVLADPSNGNGSSQFPRRTFWGWPIHYGQNMDGSLVGPGVVVHGDANISPPTDVAVEAHLAALLEQKKQQAQSQADLNARPKP